MVSSRLTWSDPRQILGSMNARATAGDGRDYLDDALVIWAREIPISIQ